MPVAAGGAIDILARSIQQVFVEANKLEVSFKGSAEVRKWLEGQYHELKNVMTSLGYAK